MALFNIANNFAIRRFRAHVAFEGGKVRTAKGTTEVLRRLIAPKA